MTTAVQQNCLMNGREHTRLIDINPRRDNEAGVKPYLSQISKKKAYRKVVPKNAFNMVNLLREPLIRRLMGPPLVPPSIALFIFLLISFLGSSLRFPMAEYPSSSALLCYLEFVTLEGPGRERSLSQAGGVQ